MQLTGVALTDMDRNAPANVPLETMDIHGASTSGFPRGDAIANTSLRLSTAGEFIALRGHGHGVFAVSPGATRLRRATQITRFVPLRVGTRGQRS